MAGLLFERPQWPTPNLNLTHAAWSGGEVHAGAAAAAPAHDGRWAAEMDEDDFDEGFLAALDQVEADHLRQCEEPPKKKRRLHAIPAGSIVVAPATPLQPAAGGSLAPGRNRAAPTHQAQWQSTSSGSNFINRTQLVAHTAERLHSAQQQGGLVLPAAGDARHDVVLEAGLVARLREHQREGVRWVYHALAAGQQQPAAGSSSMLWDGQAAGSDCFGAVLADSIYALEGDFSVPSDR